ncbi:MAG: hypothetical protein A2Y07_02600 [Planctomycetes bacterium GWF2_50_10]|nr:MAG: hypothetical protein A2Y07_02600 [Planctomycetes bacterium GWF2_50_10]
MCRDDDSRIAVFGHDFERVKKVAQYLRSDICMVMEFNCPQAFQKALSSKDFDVAVILLQSTIDDIFELIEKIKREVPGLPVLLMTTNNMIVKLDQITKSSHDTGRRMVLKSVQSVIRKRSILANFKKNNLTKTEKKVLNFLLEGCGNKEIASFLNRSSRTIEDHRANIMRKLGTDNVVELVKATLSKNGNYLGNPEPLDKVEIN